MASSFGWHLLHVFVSGFSRQSTVPANMHDLYGHAVLVTAPCCCHICSVWPASFTWQSCLRQICRLLCLFQVCEAEGNAGVARNIVRSWHEVLQTACDPATVSDMYHRAAKVCISNDSRPLAQDICRDMQSRGVDLDSQLQELVERNEQSGTSDSDEGD